MENYQNLIDHAIQCIRSGQSPDGGFTHLSGVSHTDFSDAIARKTTFFASQILAALEHIPGRTADIRNAAAQFLLSQKSAQWSFNYWARGACTDAGAFYPPYPDDLDDTFAALSALAQHDPAIIDGRVLSSVAKLLTAREVREGGPYRTWLVGNDALPAWQGTDLVVNSTIGHFLSLIGVRLSMLEQFIDSAVWEDRLTSPYYPGTFHVIYFLSRFYKNNIGESAAASRGVLADAILEQLCRNDGEHTTTLELAMAISSLIDLGYTEDVTSPMVHTLANRLEREGFLPYAFCVDPARDGTRHYAGASALTAAFCAGALARYVAQQRADAIVPRTPTLHAYICSLARTACRDIGPELRETALISIDKTTDEKITTLAYEFQDALYRSGVVVPPEITEQLSLANLYGWMAYDIYDDALDHDGDPSIIPCANFFLRMLTEIYSTLATRIPGMTDLFHGIMDRVDNANAWEQKYCRIPDIPSFGDHNTLADRSIGHAMGPLAELLFAGYGPGSEEYKSVESFFRHYLIARQLHDDAHDWAEDLMHGRVNSIGVIVLARFGKEYTATVMPELRKIFWKEVIDEAARMITAHVAVARRARQRSSVLDGTDFMESALRTLEAGARRAVRERNEVLAFLNDYRASPPSGAAF